MMPVKITTLMMLMMVHSVSGRQNNGYTSEAARHRKSGAQQNLLSPVFDGDASSYVSYKSADGTSVYPRSYNNTPSSVTSSLKQNREGILLATQKPHFSQIGNDFGQFRAENDEFGTERRNFPAEDFSAYSQEDLDRLGSKCYQYHYHYGPLYRVDQAVKSAASGIKDSVQRAATHTVQNFSHTTKRLGNALARSGKRFSRFLFGFGGKIVFLVVATVVILTVFSLFNIFITIGSGQNLFGRDASNILGKMTMLLTQEQEIQGRQLDFQDDQRYSAINVLMMLEEAFQKLEVLDFECQQRVMCEAHEAGAIEQYGDPAFRLQKIIGAADANATEGAAKEVVDAFQAFRDAAVKGVQQEDCQRTYAAKCAKGLRDLISKKI